MNLHKQKHELVILFLILSVAVFFRFYHLNVTPPGLWPDEAANGVDALKALDSPPPAGGFKIFYPANNGREGLFINIQAASIWLFGPEPLALRLVSAIFGVLTVLGLYLLAGYIYDWRTGAIASFFLAVSFWHVNFSRIGFRAIMLPFILVWAFYFMWRGLRSSCLKEFFLAGVIGGIGFYTYFSFRIAPLIALILFWSYWLHLRTHYSHEKYEETRNQMLRGFVVMLLTVIVIALPLLFYFYAHPGDFLKREGRSISVLAQTEPIKELGLSVVRTLGMFNFTGDYNQRHNIPGWPELSLPIGLFFAIGFIRELIIWLKRKHGHFSTTGTFLFSWFFIMLLPGFLSTEAPHALRTIGVIPVVMIFAAHGFRWVIGLITRYHHATDAHAYANEQEYKKESGRLLMITIGVFIILIGSLEYSRYFRTWSSDPGLNSAFSVEYVDISNYLNENPINIPRYILVNEGDVLVDGVPNNAQTIKFLTQTFDQKHSISKNIYYIRSDEIKSTPFPAKFILIPLKDNTNLNYELLWQFGLSSEKHGSFMIYKK